MMDEVLSSITLYQHFVVEDTLTNDETSTDEELLDLFGSLGMTEVQCERALKYRLTYLNNIFERGATPILSGAESYRFDPVTCMCERFDPQV